jgi:uncharacterized protein (UPF0303 family)
MVKPLPHLGADSSLMKRVSPPILTTQGGMILDLSPPCPSQASRRWDSNFQVLLQFRDREGHLRVPRLHVEDDNNLGRWIGRQRVEKRKGTLVSERERRLNEIGFIWDARKAKSVITTPSGMSLNLPRRSSMSSLPNPCCYNSSRPPRPSSQANRGDSNLLLLQQFREREGHLRVPTYHVEDGQNLGEWISTQRAQQKAGTLVSEKERLLNEIGFIWNAHEGSWDSMLSALKVFKQREGHLRVSTYHVEDGQKLGEWISTQRAQQKAGTLGSDRERRLNEIGFIWTAHEGKWETMFRALTQFKQREGYCNASRRHIEHLDGNDKVSLGTWLSQQRHQQRSELLDPKKVKRLESLGVKWNNQRQEKADAHFDRNFDLLLVFNEREGHVRVPCGHQESANDHLGKWLKHQRSLHRNGLLELDRQKWLEVAGVTWER